MTIRVLLVDDQQLVRTGFRMILADEVGIEVVGEASNGREGLDTAARSRPDVVVMDIRMPTLDGLAATRQLTAELPDVRVLILTTFEVDEYVFRALRAGASGFLGKNAEPGESNWSPRCTSRIASISCSRRRRPGRWWAGSSAGPTGTGRRLTSRS